MTNPAPTCPPINLGGLTVEDPCSGWFCNPWDFYKARDLMRAQREVLVARLNSFAALANAGRAKPSPATEAALELANDSSKRLLEEYPADNWVWLKFEGQLTSASALMIEMAARLHSAICDVDAAILAAGETPPAIPNPPPAPKGAFDSIADGLGAAAQGVAKWVAVALGLYAAKVYIDKRSNTP